MTDTQTLVKTLDFQLNIQSDNESLMYDACLEARSVYNETIRLAKQGVDWDVIPDRVADDADLVKNTTQRVVAKALGAMENYYEYDDFGQPSHTKDGAYPLRANYEEGYNLSLTDDGGVAFRISAKPYKHVKGILEGSDAHLDILKTALTSDGWKVTTSETLWCDGNPELHVNVTNTEQTVPDKQDPNQHLPRRGSRGSLCVADSTVPVQRTAGQRQARRCSRVSRTSSRRASRRPLSCADSSGWVSPVKTRAGPRRRPSPRSRCSIHPRRSSRTARRSPVHVIML